jgi:hypothetical protein
MRVIKINAQDRTIVEADEEATLEQIQGYVGGWIENGGVFENGDIIYVDEEGLLKQPEHFFTLEGFPHVIRAGNSYVVGTNSEGKSIDAQSSLQWFKDTVVFLTRQEAYMRAKRYGV